jgi:toxin ParE1/3/4
VKIRWLPKAADELEEIHAFLTINSPHAAHRVVNEIYQAIQSLSQMPHRGRPHLERNTRDLILSRIRYIVTYRVVAETIHILYIRHGSRSKLF